MQKEAKFIPSKKAKELLGVSEFSLRKWCDEGSIMSIRTPGGQRLYNVNDFVLRTINEPSNTIKEEIKSKQKICYCRVSSSGQKEDLQRQINYMQKNFPDHKIITDIGSGINFKRKGLRTILELACQGDVSEVVVAYRDRLCRFAFELIQWVLQLHGVKLLVLHESLESSGNSELAEDLLSIINIFNCRVNGKRKYKITQREEEQTSQNNEDCSEQMQKSTIEAEC